MGVASVKNSVANALAVIPARGGSKRIPRKNIRDFYGKPIIAWSIEAAFASGCFREVVVTTDDAEIAEVAVNYGANVPFLRSKDLADDHAGLAPVVADVLDRLKVAFEFACCILPTTPFLSGVLLRHAEQTLRAMPMPSLVFSGVRYSHPVQRGFRIDNGYARMMFPEHQETRSQDLDPVFHDAGQFYFFSVPWFLTRRSFQFDGALCMEVAELAVQDIDTEDDWKIAEVKWQHFYKNRVEASQFK